jgi:hypothetical protein
MVGKGKNYIRTLKDGDICIEGTKDLHDHAVSFNKKNFLGQPKETWFIWLMIGGGK